MNSVPVSGGMAIRIDGSQRPHDRTAGPQGVRART